MWYLEIPSIAKTSRHLSSMSSMLSTNSHSWFFYSPFLHSLSHTRALWCLLIASSFSDFERNNIVPGKIFNSYLVETSDSTLLGLRIDLYLKQSASLLLERMRNIFDYSSETIEALISYSTALKHSSSNSIYSLISQRVERCDSLNNISLITMFMICLLLSRVLISIWLAR